MITLTVQQMVGIVNNILPTLMNTNYDARTAFKVLRLIKAIRNEYSNVVETQKMLLEKYGSPLGDDKYNIPPQNQEAYNAELSELLTNKVELNVDKIPISCLDDLKITPMQALDADEIFE